MSFKPLKLLTMKRTITLAFCAFITTVSFAQKDKSKSVKTKFLQLPSYDLSKINPATITSEFGAGEGSFGTEKMSETESVCVPKNGGVKDAVKLKTYYYQVPFSSPESYLVAKDENGNILYASKITEAGQTTEKFGFDKCEYWIADKLKKDWASQKESFKSKQQKAFASKALESAKAEAELNVYPAYINEEFDVFTAKGKSYGYDDLDRAFDAAMGAYENIAKNGPNNKAFEQLKTAIAGWEKALEEFEPENKNARINKDIAKGLYENLGNAYMYMFDLENALKYARKGQALWGNFSNNRSQAWDNRVALMLKRKRGIEANSALMGDYDAMQAKVSASQGNGVNVKLVGTDAFAGLKQAYMKYMMEEGAAQRDAAKKEEEEAVARGDVNPYDKYVTKSATQGKMIMMSPLMMSPELTEFPKEMCEITDLQQVIIMNNKIASVPAEIGNLKELNKLDLKGNQIKEIPKEIGQLAQLETLNLSNNPITSLPDEIKNCKSLKKLMLKGTNLSADEQSKLQRLLPDTKIKF